MSLLKDSNGIIFGVSNRNSLGFAIAQAAVMEGATVTMTFHSERSQKNAEELRVILGDCIKRPQYAMHCDACKDEDVRGVFEYAADHGKIDFIVHCVVGAPLKALIKGASRDHGIRSITDDEFCQAMRTSVHSLFLIAKHAKSHMIQGGSILTLTSMGSERVLKGYGITGVTKAALEGAVRTLAEELGPQQIRVNALSVGPVKTNATKVIPNFDAIVTTAAQVSPMRRQVDLGEIGTTAVCLLSQYMPLTTGSIIYADGGLHIATL